MASRGLTSALAVSLMLVAGCTASHAAAGRSPGPAPTVSMPTGPTTDQASRDMCAALADYRYSSTTVAAGKKRHWAGIPATVRKAAVKDKAQAMTKARAAGARSQVLDVKGIIAAGWDNPRLEGWCMETYGTP